MQYPEYVNNSFFSGFYDELTGLLEDLMGETSIDNVKLEINSIKLVCL